MRGLSFDPAAPELASAPERADVALFAGFVARRETPLPASLGAWLAARGWSRPSLLDVPVPIDSWDLFQRLYAWERRPLHGGGAPYAQTYLGAAVRSFFAQGGRRCYVVRSGDPWSLDAPREDRLDAVRQLVPGLSRVPMSPLDRARWRGLAHLYELPDVSLASLPDLPDACAQDEPPPPAKDPPARPAPPEVFVECAEHPPAGPPGPPRIAFGAPRCHDEDGYADWKEIVRMAGRFLSIFRRDVQLVASVPLPGSRARTAADPLDAFLRGGLLAGFEGGGVASAFVQLVYPWIAGARDGLPEGLEPPEGAVAGAIARTVLLEGAFHSAARAPLFGVSGLSPRLGAEQRERKRPWSSPGADPVHALVDRFTLLGETPDGFALLSDVTTSGKEAWRHACVNRLVGVLIRACRLVGERHVFETSDERTWATLRDAVRGVLLTLWQLGALRGDSASEALEVDCDRTTMSQQDLDEGRLVVRVVLQPAPPVERITVRLAVTNGGVTALSAGEAS